MLPASVPVDLTWNAPAECPSRDVVLEEVGRVLTTPPEPGVQATARADVTRDESGRWHATLAVAAREARSERTLEAESCPAIVSATAVIVAVAIEGGIRQPPATPLPEPPRPAAPPPSLGSQLVIAAGGVIDGGALPKAAPGAEAAVGWTYRWPVGRIRVLATGSFFPSQSSDALQSPAAVAGEYGSLDLFASSLRGCASIVREALDVGLCLGAEVDVMNGKANVPGTQPPSFTPHSGTGVWASGLVSVLALWSVSRHVAVYLRADGLASSAPPFGVRLTVSGVTQSIPIHQPYPASLGARGALGLEMRFF
jgi:hypothetical protein